VVAGVSQTHDGQRLADRIALVQVQAAAKIEAELSAFLSLLGFPLV
jgi:hypothetical protein